MQQTELNELKEKLLAEKARLESELNKISVRDPKNPSDWQATYEEGEERDGVLEIEPDRSDAADRIEEYQKHFALNDPLERELNIVLNALKQIEIGAYGICEVCKNPIEMKRLEVFPGATTCVAHKK